MRFLPAAVLLLAATPAAAEQIGQDAAVCGSGQGPAIQVNVQGLKDRAGELWLELYSATDADYLRPDQDLVAEGKTFRRTRARLPAAGPIEICVKVPKPGRYALMLRHNRVGRDKFSFWSDGAGVPASSRWAAQALARSGRRHRRRRRHHRADPAAISARHRLLAHRLARWASSIDTSPAGSPGASSASSASSSRSCRSGMSHG